MKYRNDFVTNSSSSSFIISLDDVTASQMLLIKNFEEIAEKEQLDYWEWASDWWISVDYEKDIIEGHCSMDNFSMYDFLKSIVNVDMDKVEFRD